jgi:6-phosphogluconolactonase
MTTVTGTGTLLVFVSMFAPEGTGGIRGFRLDGRTGALEAVGEAAAVAHPFFLALSPDRRTLYSTAAEKFSGPADEEVVAWRIDEAAGRLTEIGRQSSRGRATCYVAVDASGRSLLVAHYTGGGVTALPLAADGAIGPAACVIPHDVPAGRTKSHAHAIVPVPAADGPPFVYVPDLGIDRILGYRLDPAAARLVPAAQPFVDAPEKSGPRHLALHPDGRRLYAVNELGNSVTVYDRDPASGGLDCGPTLSTLPEDFTGKSFCADVAITADGRFLYATNRGHDSIAVFRVAADGRLERLAIVPSRGGSPQNLALVPGGRLLLCANMTGGNVAVFGIAPETGLLEPIGDPVAVTSPSCIRIVGR